MLWRVSDSPQNAAGMCFHSSHTSSTFRGSFSPSQAATRLSICSAGEHEPSGGPAGDDASGWRMSATSIS